MPNSPRAQAPAGTQAGQTADLIYEGRARPSAYIGAYAKWTLVTIAGVVLGVMLGKIEFFAKLGFPLWALGLIGLPGILVVYLRFRTTKYKLTSRRVEYERGIINRDVDALELWRVLDVRYRQNIIDRMTGNARITLIGTDKSDPELDLYGLPDHRKLFEHLQDAVQAARTRGRPMEVVGQDGGLEDLSGGMFDHQ